MIVRRRRYRLNSIHRIGIYIGFDFKTNPEKYYNRDNETECTEKIGGINMLKTDKDLEKAYKRLEEIDKELEIEYNEYGESIYTSRLELEYEDLEKELCDYEEQMEI